MTARSQGLKAHEEGSTNPSSLKHHMSWCAAERTVDEHTAERERIGGGGGGGGEGKKVNEMG